MPKTVPTSSENLSPIVQIALVICAAAAFFIPALGIRTFLFQPFSIPASSMTPALVEGDYVFVSKLAYGYSRYSFPSGMAHFNGRVFSAPPKRGDIVVFRPPSNPDLDYVKRVIALPGDTISMRDGRVAINGQTLSLEPAGRYPADANLPDGADLQIETLPDGVSYYVLNLADDTLTDNFPETVVPEGRFFVLGDNRDNSTDSRLQVGMVPFENLVGKAVYIFWNSEGKSTEGRAFSWPAER
jgi:signal peptidase I